MTTPKDQARAKWRAGILARARRDGNVARTCRAAGISRTVFYRWKRRHDARGLDGLQDASRRPRRAWRKTPSGEVAKILYLRLAMGWGPSRIRACLAAVHGIRISEAGIWKILARLGYGRRPGFPARPARAEGRTVFLTTDQFPIRPGGKKRAILHAAVDEEASVGVVRLDRSRDARGAASFVDTVVSLFPWRVETIVTPLREEYEGYFHWHVLGLGIEHRYEASPLPRPKKPLWDREFLARAGSPRLSGGTIVCRDGRIQQAVEAWERAVPAVTGRAGSAGPRSR